MARHTHTLACLTVLLAVTSSTKEQSRWSRQISSYTADISDWVPLAGPVQREAPRPSAPIKRQAIAEPRILSEPFPGLRGSEFGQEPFPARTYYNSAGNRQLYLQSVPSAPQNYLNDQGFGQSIRFGLTQPNFPLNQAFISPQFMFDNTPVAKTPTRNQPPPAISNPVKFENFPKQQAAPIAQIRPFNAAAIKPKPEAPKFMDGYRLENATNDFGFNKKKAQSLQKLKFQGDVLPKTDPIPSKPKVEREEVQLLYVPLESLNKGQFNFKNQMPTQVINSDFYSQGQPKLETVKQALASEYQRPIHKQNEHYDRINQFGSNYDPLASFDQVPKFSTITSPFPTPLPTTPKPKKLKPHQPPLAIFQEAKKNSQIKVGDVLSSLKHANTIAVLDSVNPSNAPKVFIGPSSLTPPENFVKFELPYLSNIDNVDKKLRQLPFFVAPLSYSTPQGFAKIPFPSPHVGSVVINSLIKETPSYQMAPQTQTTPRTYTTQAIHSTASASVIQNSFPDMLLFKQDKPATQKPSFNYYSTVSPKTNAPNQQSNYYSFEPQTVTSISPQRPEPVQQYFEPQNTAAQKGNFFLTNQFNLADFNFPPPSNYEPQAPVKPYTIPKPETTTTLKTTTTTTTAKPSTYPSQLLETHNPYSINQAFHFSTPLDYHSYFDEFKETYAPPGVNLELPKSSQTPVSSTPIAPTSLEPKVTEKPRQQTSPNYLQNYSPEIHYESEVMNSRYQVFTNDYTTKPELTAEPQVSTKTVSTVNVQPTTSPQQQYNGNIDYQPTAFENLTETIINRITGPSSDLSNIKYDQYETENVYETSEKEISSTTSTTTTTTRRTPIRNRGRPRYTTAKPDSNDATTRTTITRRPLSQRRPIPPRSKYEPNKISTERTTKKSADSNESTTKSSRGRTRGRVQYKSSDNEDYYDKRNKVHNSKEDDLAYQRDILHQNYPVTLMERGSTVDIEAITEPAPKISSTKNLESATDTYDTENAYAHESPAISHVDSQIKDDIPNYTSRDESHYEDISVPKHSSTVNEEYYESRGSTVAASADTFNNHENVARQTTPTLRDEKLDVNSYTTEPIIPITEQPNYSLNSDQIKQEEITETQKIDIPNSESQEGVNEEEPEENVVQTTPSYNRVRVRPGVIRQYHQSSSTESSKTKTDRRRIAPAVTYRPAFDRRRTTMRIEEIEADLKTKQVHSRTEGQDYRHPVYKPEANTEPATTSATQDSTVKRGQFRRRRPSYSTTSTTESASTKKIYEVKNRFRGRRPTVRPTNKPETQTETSSTTTRSTFNRYSHRPRLSERYNSKPEPEETEDQDSNYSINRPKYITLDNEQWSPKITAESFKPYNPNEITDETKIATTERRSDKINEAELDIITARNDYDDILISVTPASNNRGNKKLPDIPPTLEALVEQSKTTNSDTTISRSNFESMLEEVMKSLEEQDENEYTSNVMKHKGGEIGEIPPERIISSGDENAAKSTTALEQEIITTESTAEESTNNDEKLSVGKSRRRGFWKKVRVRPASTESIEAAESQYYPNTVNRLGESVQLSKVVHEKSNKYNKPKYSVTTYKPTFEIFKDIFGNDEEPTLDEKFTTDFDIAKLNSSETEKKPEDILGNEENKDTTPTIPQEVTTIKTTSVGDEDLGTGSPDPTLIDNMYHSTPTEPTASEDMMGMFDKSGSFSFMEYLFGSTASDVRKTEKMNDTIKDEPRITTNAENIEINTEQIKSKSITTESSYVPDEITAVPTSDDNVENITELDDFKKIFGDDENTRDVKTTLSPAVETSSESSFMNPANVVSTSMSTEVSHETEICFRGKCIKTSKDIL